MMLDDASALAAAEQLVQQLAKTQQQQDGGAANAMQGDAAGTCCLQDAMLHARNVCDCGTWSIAS
jgi:hypothetical protein